MLLIFILKFSESSHLRCDDILCWMYAIEMMNPAIVIIWASGRESHYTVAISWKTVNDIWVLIFGMAFDNERLCISYTYYVT